MAYEGRMRGLEKNYENVLVEMVGFQRGVAQQDGVMKGLIRCFLSEENDSELFFSFLVRCLLYVDSTLPTSAFSSSDACANANHASKVFGLYAHRLASSFPSCVLIPQPFF